MNLPEVLEIMLNKSEIYQHYVVLVIQILFKILRDECGQKANFSGRPSGHMKKITQNIFWEFLRINFVFSHFLKNICKNCLYRKNECSEVIQKMGF